ncbi:hypothetical protein ACVIGB_000848 [Bradyrhizobium sp. USDA 4341]
MDRHVAAGAGQPHDLNPIIEDQLKDLRGRAARPAGSDYAETAGILLV